VENTIAYRGAKCGDSPSKCAEVYVETGSHKPALSAPDVLLSYLHTHTHTHTHTHMKNQGRIWKHLRKLNMKKDLPGCFLSLYYKYIYRYEHFKTMSKRNGTFSFEHLMPLRKPNLWSFFPKPFRAV